MVADSHKAKHYGFIALKVLILGVTFGYIYKELTSSTSIRLSTFLDALAIEKPHFIESLFLFIGLTSINWFFEILKWKTVVSVVKKIDFLKAAKQCFTALTVSLATPNRIGDYGAKALFFKKEKRKKIVVLNFFSNTAQMMMTSFFGAIGLTYMILNYEVPLAIWKIVAGVVALIILVILGYRFKEKQLLIKGFSIEKLIRFVKELPSRMKLLTLLYALLRYITFCYLFFLLLNYFNAEITLLRATPIIFSMYLLVSILPSFFIFDVVIRGGVAVWLFSFIGLTEWTVLCTVLAMWILNFLVPAIIGSFFVANYKLEAS